MVGIEKGAAALALLAIVATGCSSNKSSQTSTAAGQTTALPKAVAAPGNAKAGDLDHGKQVFTQNCASCHGAAGQGGVGPSLKRESSRKNLAQAEAWIKNPQPPMPKLYPSPLSEKDVADVASFVETLK